MDEEFGGSGGDGGNVNSGQNDGGGINPAWNDLLNTIPQEYHGPITNHLKNWDQGVQAKLQQVHSQYEPFKPFIQSGVNPQELQMGYGILQALNEDPRRVWEAIAEHYGLNSEQGETEEEDETPGNLPPEIAQKLQQFETWQDQVSRLLVSQREAELSKAAEQELDRELSELATKYGEFDERIVLPLMQNGMSAEDAVKHYFSIMDNLATKASRPKPPPRVLGSGGGAIQQGGVDPRKLSSQEVKNLIVQQLLASEQR